jgi:DNA polymerase-3 subunit alpha
VLFRSISKLIPFKAGTTLEDVMKSNKDFAAVMKKYPKLLECARHIEGTLSAGGVHPAGIIVCKDPVIERIPLRNAKGVICSQFVGPEVETLGLLKFDLLALKTLTVIDKSLKMIKERHNKDIDIDKLDPVDKEVFKIFNGTDEFRDTKGVFQFEADGISKLLMAIRVDRFEDLIIANALYRPGPLGAGVHEMYCNYKHGVEEIKYLHPKMGEVLNETYGIMIFQENIMKIATHLAGFSRGKADTLRKVVGKKKPELIKKEKLDDLFIEGCAKNGIDKEIAKKIFEQICYFAGYGFNKCLSGDTLVLNKKDKFYYTLKDLCDYKFGKKYEKSIILDSYINGKIVEDEIVDVFETGEKEIYEVELDNGMIIKCTLDHEFYCLDGQSHTVKEIMEKDLEVLYEDNSEIKEGK